MKTTMIVIATFAICYAFPTVPLAFMLLTGAGMLVLGAAMVIAR